MWLIFTDFTAASRCVASSTSVETALVETFTRTTLPCAAASAYSVPFTVYTATASTAARPVLTVSASA